MLQKKRLPIGAVSFFSMLKWRCWYKRIMIMKKFLWPLLCLLYVNVFSLTLKNGSNESRKSVSGQDETVVAGDPSGRIVTDISGNNWKLWLDKKARWINDPLFAHPGNLARLPVNIPTGGWDVLQQSRGKEVHLPATV